MRVASLGEILWDLIGDRELLGGATFNFSVQLTRLGHDVSFLSAVGNDARGIRALERARELRLPTQHIDTVSDAPTGTVSVTVDAAGQPSYVLHRPAAYDFVAMPEDNLEPDWLYHGTLQFITPRMLDLLHELTKRYPDARRFYDVNLRKDSYSTPLVIELLESADVAKLNDEELVKIQEMTGTDSLYALVERFGWEAVCVTRGEHGCTILHGDDYAEVVGVPAKVADTVGAGDAFAAAFLHGLDAGWPAERIGVFANKLGSIVASRPGGVPDWTWKELA